MTDPNFYLAAASAGLAGLGMVTMAALTGWRGWLAYKSQELALRREARAEDDMPGVQGAGARIEMADLRERIRKLEAIAAGVDL